jgi:heptosyltransferase I
MRYILKNRFNIFFVFIIDLIGNIIFLLFRIFRKRKPGNVGNILIIRLDDTGDVLFSTPVPYNLKQHYRGSKITFLTAGWAKELIMDNPYVDEVICYDAPWFNRKNKKVFEFRRFFKLAGELRRHNYDLGIDLKGDFRHIVLMALSGVRFRTGYGITGGGFLLHRKVDYRENVSPIEHNLDILRAMPIDIITNKPMVYASKESEQDIAGFMRESSIEENDFIAIIHADAGCQSKNWLDERFTGLIDIISKDYKAKIILVGSEEDKAKNDKIISLSNAGAINAVGKISLGGLTALMKKASLFIGIDSGPGHIAAIEGIPSVIISSNIYLSDEWANIGEKSIRIQKDIPCKGCENLNCRYNVCMDLISIGDVLDAVESLIGAVSRV